MRNVHEHAVLVFCGTMTQRSRLAALEHKQIELNCSHPQPNDPGNQNTTMNRTYHVCHLSRVQYVTAKLHCQIDLNWDSSHLVACTTVRGYLLSSCHLSECSK